MTLKSSKYCKIACFRPYTSNGVSFPISGSLTADYPGLPSSKSEEGTKVIRRDFDWLLWHQIYFYIHHFFLLSIKFSIKLS